MKWKQCTTNWLQNRTVEARRRGREQNPHGDIALFVEEAGLDTSTSQFCCWLDPHRYRWHIRTHLCLSPLRSPSLLDVCWNLPRMAAARSRTVSRVSGSQGKKKKETAKSDTVEMEGRLPGKQGISPLPSFSLHRSIQTCHFVQVVLGCC